MSTSEFPVGMATSSPDPPTTTVQLPNEIWKVVISNLWNDDLKSMRLVNSTFKDFASPRLFHHVVFSLSPDNLENLVELSKSDELAKHVEHMYLDLTGYVSDGTVETYATWMATYHQLFSGLEKPQVSGPFSEARLKKVLMSNPARDLGDDYLCGSVRTAFLTGYAQAMARWSSYTVLSRKDGIYPIFTELFARFPHISSIESICGWHRAKDHPVQFSRYLRKHLPEKTFKQIPGFEDLPAVSKEVEETGGWVAPGITARQSHLMCPVPMPCICNGLYAEHDITMAALRALKDSPHITLRTLALPGPDSVRRASILPAAATPTVTGIHSQKPCGRPNKMGIVTVPTLAGVPHGPDADKQSLILPVFRQLKNLELQIDYSHPGTPRATQRYHIDLTRIPRALQAMKVVETLRIGYARALRPMPGFPLPPPISLYDTMLRRDEDFEVPEDQDADGPPADAPSTGAPTPQEFLNLLAGLMNQAPQPAGVATSNTLNSGPQASTGGGTPAPQAQQGAFQFTTQIDPTTGFESLYASADLGTFGDLGMNFAVPELKPITGPLEPNPWPKLKHLALWRMPATKKDVTRLIQTVAPTLQSLELRKVYFNRSKTESQSTEQPTPETSTDPPVTSPGDAEMDGLVPETQSFDEVEDDEPSVLAEKDDWYETIEIMADALRLKSCNIIFGKTDMRRLEAKLQAQIEGLAESRLVLDILVSDYILKGNGMGLALWVADAVKMKVKLAKSTAKEAPKEEVSKASELLKEEVEASREVPREEVEASEEGPEEGPEEASEASKGKAKEAPKAEPKEMAKEEAKEEVYDDLDQGDGYYTDDSDDDDGDDAMDAENRAEMGGQYGTWMGTMRGSHETR